MTAVFSRFDHADNLSGILLAAAAFAFSSGGDVIYKLLAAGHPCYQILAVNGLFALLPVFLCAHYVGGLARLRTTRPWQHTLRALFGVVSTLVGVYAFKSLPLTDFYAIVFAGPLLVTALSTCLLGEKVDRNSWLAILGGFLGVILVISPTSMPNATSDNTVVLGRLSALVCVLFYALSVIMVRRMKSHESSLIFSIFGYGVSISLGLGLWLLLGAAPLSAQEIDMLILSGMLNSIGNLCLMEAYVRAPVALVAPFQYTQIFWGAIASFILWHTVPSPALVAGAGVVMLSGIYLLHHSQRKPRATVTPPSEDLYRLPSAVPPAAP